MKIVSDIYPPIVRGNVDKKFFQLITPEATSVRRVCEGNGTGECCLLPALPHPASQMQQITRGPLHNGDSTGQARASFLSWLLIPAGSLQREPGHSQRCLTCSLELENIHEQRAWGLERPPKIAGAVLEFMTGGRAGTEQRLVALNFSLLRVGQDGNAWLSPTCSQGEGLGRRLDLSRLEKIPP